MSIRNLRYDGEDILRKPSKAVKELTPAIQLLIDDMIETMQSKNGLGLAAPQVGVLRRVIVIDVGNETGLVVMLNPEIVFEVGKQNLSEGCLSVPGKRGVVERPEKVRVKGFDRHFKEQTIEAEGLQAIAFCHEIDHLNGILYIDKATDIEDLNDTNDHDDDFESNDE